MTDEPTTEVFFAVELTSDGAVQIYREPVEWKEGTHIATIPEISDLASRVSKELDRHLVVSQMTDKIADMLEDLFPAPEVRFSDKLMEALNERGITPGKKDD